MNVTPRRPLFNRRPQSNIYRMFVWVVMLLGCVWILQQVSKGNIRPLLQPTPIPTRAIQSYLEEGEASFSAGNLNQAITSYQEALKLNPNDAQTWAKLARIQTYSSIFLTTNPEKKARLLEALDSANKAVAFAPEDSTAHAILAFTLDWNANSNFHTSEEVQAYLQQAEQEALVAQQKDNTNTLALAYYAEILVDEQKWNQAQIIINQALERPDADQLMDVHRINAYVMETFGQYNLAISEYEKAFAIEPNFTYLYLRIGANYRRLAFDVQRTQGEDAARPVYEQSLDWFDKAARINEQLEVKDPTPYLSISRTYSQLGDFFAAALNVKKALKFDPTNADIYGQLGIIYFRSRNYEGSIDTFRCALRGCTGEASCLGRGLDRCYPDLGENPVTVKGLAIDPVTIVYYYTYGSVLAALSRPADNKCPEAMQVMQEVRNEITANADKYADGRDTIVSIVEDGEFICRSLGTGNASNLTATPEGTGTVASDTTTQITETPTPALTLDAMQTLIAQFTTTPAAP
jgi:tetratricopeptide (TPR) repeat protein